MSRSTVFEFKPLSHNAVKQAITRALDYLNRENNADKTLTDEAMTALSVSGGGDLRASVNALELAFHISGDEITEENAKSVLARNYMSFDRDGDNLYELLSALQKSIRGSDENAAIFYLPKLLEGRD